MTTKRETIGAAAKLVMSADRCEVSADGEDVAMFAVKVHDAQGRVRSHYRQSVTFKVSGPESSSASATAIPPTRNPTRAPRARPSAVSAWALCSRPNRRSHHR